MTQQSATPGATFDFPTGLFTYAVDDASPMVEFDGQGDCHP